MSSATSEIEATAPPSSIDIDALERAMCAFPDLNLPLRHTFTPGLYAREITMPAGACLTSKIHKTEHPFVISKGRVKVYDERNGVVELTAPYFGVTKPGTRRVLRIEEETVWTTFHPTGPLGLGEEPLTENDLDRLEEALIEPHFEHLPRRLDARGHVVPPALPKMTER